MFNLRPFQILLYGGFIALALVGLIVFATFRASDSEDLVYGSQVEIWGTLDQGAFSRAIRSIVEADDEAFGVVVYREKDPRTFRNELVNAIAEGRGPDAVVLSHDMLLRERAKLFATSYETFPRRAFVDTYVDGADIFMFNNGIYGFPLGVDPLVMYWNRDIFSTEGFALPPRTWEEIVGAVAPRISQVTPDLDITRSAIAFGEYANIANAKEIMLMLILQAGSEMVTQDSDGDFEVRLNDASAATSRPPTEAALDFYTQFSNPARAVYSWNLSLPFAREAFLSGDVALYFGFASERETLARGNPNLNFDVARVPQGSTATIEQSYGVFYTMVPLQSSSNLEGTFRALSRLSSTFSATQIVNQLDIAPVHRTVIAGGNPDPFFQSIYDSALIARGWLDPNDEASENIFRMMIEDVTSGRLRVSQSVQDAVRRLQQLFP